MTSNRLRSLLGKLPKPVAQHRIQGAVFRIYCLKKMHCHSYFNNALYRLMLTARRSYYRYGDVPLSDAYDKKASIYLVRVTYEAHKIEEWLCARFVPGDGEPFGIDDFELYLHKKKLLEPMVEDLIFQGLFSISRLCGIPSYLRFVSDEKRFSAHHIADLKYTPIAFALMNKKVLADCRKFGFGCDYVVAQIPDALVEGFLTLKIGKQKFKPNFVPAYKHLRVADKDIKLARVSYIYRYPLYFLKTSKVIALLKMLIKKNILSDAAIRRYSCGTLTAKDILRRRDFKVEEFRWLGKPIIKNSKLRAWFAQVPDGPKLRIIKVNVWERSLDKLIRAARIRAY